jgi:NADH-quinone oxidoreductase subunit I
VVKRVFKILKAYKWTLEVATKGTEVTRMYPEVMMELPEFERGIHELDATICIGCGSCARICPNSCIEMVPYKYGNPLKNKKMVFPQIDFGRCMFCGLCVDECPVSCLKMGKRTEITGWRRDDIVYGPDKISVKKHSDKEVAELEAEAKRIALEKKKAAAAAAKEKAAKAEKGAKADVKGTKAEAPGEKPPNSGTNNKKAAKKAEEGGA